MAARVKTAKTPAAARAAAKGANLLPDHDGRQYLRRLQAEELILWEPSTLCRHLARRGWITYAPQGWKLTDAGRAVLDKTSCWA